MSDRVWWLVDLQNLELQIRESQDPAWTEQEESLGFSVSGHLEALEKRRGEVLKKIPKRDLRLYERIKKRYNLVVVPVRDRICRGCFQELPTASTRAVAAEGPLPTCESCGRVLYWL